jgi:hypothetical protein
VVWVAVVPAVAVVGLVVLAAVALRLWRQVRAATREVSAALGQVSAAVDALATVQDGHATSPWAHPNSPETRTL